MKVAREAVASEAVEGLDKLRNAVILSLSVSDDLVFLFILISVGLAFLTGNIPIREAKWLIELILEFIKPILGSLGLPIGLIPVVIVSLALLALLVLVGPFMLNAWISRVQGWRSMCKSGWRTKEFYTVVWLTVTFGSVASLLLIVVGISLLIVAGITEVALELLLFFTGGALTTLLHGLIAPAVGIMIMAIVLLIEGVALLDVGSRTKVRHFSAGFALYVVTALSLLLPGGLIVASVAHLVANFLLAVGFNKVKENMAVAPEVQ